MKINSELTWSKILAFLILILGGVGAFYFHDKEVLTESFIYSGVVMGIKAGMSEYKKSKDKNV